MFGIRTFSFALAIHHLNVKNLIMTSIRVRVGETKAVFGVIVVIVA